MVVVEADDAEEVTEAVAGRLREAGLAFDRIAVTRDPIPLDPRHNAKIDYRRLREKAGRELCPGGDDV